MITAQGVVVERGGRRLLDDVGLGVDEGRWLGVLGANGAGKTTLLRCLAGTMAHGGTVRLAGAPTPELSVRQRARLVAVVAQDPLLPGDMAALDYVLLGRTAHLPVFGVETGLDHQIAHALLDRLGLSDLSHQALATLSGGERQRAVLARALAQEAPILLLDEPTSSLDVGHQQRVLALVDELRRERNLTVVSAMHDLTLAAQYGDDFVLLDHGRVRAAGGVDAVFQAEPLSACFAATLEVSGRGHDTVVTPRRLATQPRR